VRITSRFSLVYVLSHMHTCKVDVSAYSSKEITDIETLYVCVGNQLTGSSFKGSSCIFIRYYICLRKFNSHLKFVITRNCDKICYCKSVKEQLCNFICQLSRSLASDFAQKT
jgi:hypothetical protein